MIRIQDEREMPIAKFKRFRYAFTSAMQEEFPKFRLFQPEWSSGYEGAIRRVFSNVILLRIQDIYCDLKKFTVKIYNRKNSEKVISIIKSLDKKYLQDFDVEILIKDEVE